LKYSRLPRRHRSPPRLAVSSLRLRMPTPASPTPHDRNRARSDGQPKLAKIPRTVAGKEVVDTRKAQ
jgi:hypothetical protein